MRNDLKSVFFFYYFSCNIFTKHYRFQIFLLSKGLFREGLYTKPIWTVNQEKLFTFLFYYKGYFPVKRREWLIARRTFSVHPRTIRKIYRIGGKTRLFWIISNGIEYFSSDACRLKNGFCITHSKKAVLRLWMNLRSHVADPLQVNDVGTFFSYWKCELFVVRMRACFEKNIQKSSFWKGGMSILTMSSYHDLSLFRKTPEKFE